jgi:DNA-binding cell septation regulator SpoVG
MAAPNIQIQIVNNAEPLLAYAKVPLTLYNKNHVIIELKVLNGNRGPWVALPQRKEGDGWVPIVQIPEDIWEKVRYAVLLAYNTKRNSQASSKQNVEHNNSDTDRNIAHLSPKAKEKKEQIPVSVLDDNKLKIPTPSGESRSKQIEELSVSELIKLQPRRRIHLPDRQKRVSFLERKYGNTYRGKPIKYMTNRQLYAISQKCGYR